MIDERRIAYSPQTGISAYLPAVVANGVNICKSNPMNANGAHGIFCVRNVGSDAPFLFVRELLWGDEGAVRSGLESLVQTVTRVNREG